MWDFSVFLQPDAYIALVTLTAMEIVLGIDNIVFLSILTDKLPASERARARTVGLSLALFMRLGLLLAISWIMSLTEPLFAIGDNSFSARDLILGGGGLFLLAKATHEIFENIELPHDDIEDLRWTRASFTAVIVQILLLDIVFSLDSVITAVGMAQQFVIMGAAVVVAVGVMLYAAGYIADFVNRNPSMKILALSFLMMIGIMLCAEALGQHINKGYIYFAMGFSLVVEMLNMKVRGDQRKPVDAPVR